MQNLRIDRPIGRLSTICSATITGPSRIAWACLIVWAATAGIAPAGDYDVSYFGFLEYEYFLNTKMEQDFENANTKHELRHRAQFSLAGDALSLYMVTNQYVLLNPFDDLDHDRFRYNDTSDVSRNLTISDEDYEISFNEFYLNYSGSGWRVRAGNQIYSWGTANATNPTSYFNPPDIREFVFRGDDESKPGIPSVSGMFFGDGYTVEVVLAPIHVPDISAPNNDFWAIQIPNPNTHTLYFDRKDGMDITVENMGLGARFSTNFGGADMALSAYRGPDNKKDAIKVPHKILYLPNEPLMIVVEPNYDIIHEVGMDFSMTAGQFVLKFEAIYSPDNPALIDQDDKELKDLSWPFEVVKTDYVSFATGFNWFVPLNAILEEHEGESVFTCEFSKAKYLDSDVSEPFVPDLLTLRYDDSFLYGQLTTSVTAVIDTMSGSYLVWPQIGYIFQNGIRTDISYGYIRGVDDKDGLFDPIFYYFNENDVFMWRIRYEY